MQIKLNPERAFMLKQISRSRELEMVTSTETNNLRDRSPPPTWDARTKTLVSC